MTSPTSDIIADFLTREADLRDMAPDDYDENVTAKMREAAALISSLVEERDAGAETALRIAGKYADAADRVDALTTRALTAERLLAEARATLEKLACRHVTEEPLWWQLEARAALSIGGGNGP